MKNIYFLFVVSIVLLGCKKQEPGTIDYPTSPTATKDCYQVQSINGYGEVMNGYYDCVRYVKNYGDDFQSAYDNLQSTINDLKGRLYDDYKNSADWDANRIEVRKVQCAVRNTPDDTLEYYSVDIYMYNINPYKDYMIVYYFWIIDSKGNAYAREFPDD